MKITRRIGFSKMYESDMQYSHGGGIVDRQVVTATPSRTHSVSRLRSWTVYKGRQRTYHRNTHCMVSRGTFYWETCGFSTNRGLK